MKFENQYLTYNEYKELGGKLIEKSFNLLEYRAEKNIDEMSSNRFNQLSKDTYPQELKLCVYELINILHSENSSITSEKVGDYSVTHQSSKESKKAKENIIKQYLSEVKVNGVYVLYCGADEK